MGTTPVSTAGAAATAVLLTVACGAQRPTWSDQTDWVGTISTEGNVTTVVNEAGSVWGGAATLVEEASIGVEAGPDEYMFGMIAWLHASDERIFVADYPTQVVRMFDHAGAFVGDLGRSGQGPGEYTSMGPLTTDEAGRIFLLDGQLQRINVYSPAGEAIETWPITTSRCCAWAMFPLGHDTLWVSVRELRDRNYRNGLQAVGPDGPFGEVTWVPDIEYESAGFAANGRELESWLGPSFHWNPMPARRIVYGSSDSYRFYVLHDDGRTLIVEKYGEPAPIPAAHKEWQRRYRIAFERRANDPEMTWDGAGMPDHHPAYDNLEPTLDGAVWVRRPSESRAQPDCAEDPIEAGFSEATARQCWRTDAVWDAFEPEGRFLGEVVFPLEPGERVYSLNIAGDRVVGVSQDEAGTYRVKRYRLVPPAEGDA